MWFRDQNHFHCLFYHFFIIITFIISIVIIILIFLSKENRPWHVLSFLLPKDAVSEINVEISTTIQVRIFCFYFIILIFLIYASMYIWIIFSNIADGSRQEYRQPKMMHRSQDHQFMSENTDEKKKIDMAKRYCYEYKNKGSCARGEDCWYMHYFQGIIYLYIFSWSSYFYSWSNDCLWFTFLFRLYLLYCILYSFL